MAINKLDRRDSILAYIEQKGRASIEELCTFLDSSQATVRRDLARLAAEELIQRVHGGAVVGKRLQEEPPVLQRCAVFTPQKQAIGKKAAEMIHDGETVFLGSGSTVLEVARNLRKNRVPD